jgi:hypothetical protein
VPKYKNVIELGILENKTPKSKSTDLLHALQGFIIKL